jgi:hypothetical protein
MPAHLSTPLQLTLRPLFRPCLHAHLPADPEVLVPKLPKPQDLQPFPTLLSVRYTGHTKPVRSVAPDATGQWLLSGGGELAAPPAPPVP